MTSYLLFEELIFREFYFSELNKTLSTRQAAIVSSILFACMHLPQDIFVGEPRGMLGHLIFTFVLGLILCFIYRKTNNLLIIVMLHLTNNLLNVNYMIIEVLLLFIIMYIRKQHSKDTMQNKTA